VTKFCSLGGNTGYPTTHPGGGVHWRVVGCMRLPAPHALYVVAADAEVLFAKSHTVSKASSPVTVTPPLFSTAFSVRGINHARLNATHSDN